ncbi:thiamine pyrophosphate-binding protein [Rhizobium yanglingense]
MKKTGGELIVEALKANGVNRHLLRARAKAILAVLDALYDTDIEVIVCRQEGGAAMMADCWGRLTGEPGICMVTRGPGATNAIGGPAYRQAGFDPDDPVHRPGRSAMPASARPSRRSSFAAR